MIQEFSFVYYKILKQYKYCICLNERAVTLISFVQRQDGEQVITPFNLNDEEEEGHFDENGTFIFDKKGGEEIRDSWLDSIDMQKVRLQRRYISFLNLQFFILNHTLVHLVNVKPGVLISFISATCSSAS